MAPTSQANAAHDRQLRTVAATDGDLGVLEAFVTEDVVNHDLVFGDGQHREAGDVMGRTVHVAIPGSLTE